LINTVEQCRQHRTDTTIESTAAVTYSAFRLITCQRFSVRRVQKGTKADERSLTAVYRRAIKKYMCNDEIHTQWAKHG
jgi:hypothetical protein